MQMLSTRRTAVLLLAIVMVTAGCGARGIGSVEPPTGTSPATAAQTTTSTTPATIADVSRVEEEVEPTGPQEIPQVASSTTTPGVPAAPHVAVDDIDSMIDGVDKTLAELNQLLDQAAAALAAEEGEIIP